ncbi:hypothetical protein SRHO_G00328500 [Serrasalmus rhombeus]
MCVTVACHCRAGASAEGLKEAERLELTQILQCQSDVQHKNTHITLCSDTEKQDMSGLDGEEMWHADFTQGKGVETLPEFADPSSSVEGAYEAAVVNVEVCKQNLAVSVDAYHHPAEPRAKT